LPLAGLQKGVLPPQLTQATPQCWSTVHGVQIPAWQKLPWLQ
jgi:hypothetical protein